MKIPLAEMAVGVKRKTVALRPIDPTAALEADLYRIYLDSVRVWVGLARDLVGQYVRSPLTTDADGRQMQWLVDQAAAKAANTVFTQTDKLGRWVARVGTWHGERTVGSVKSALGVDIAPYVRLLDVQDLLQDSIRANVALITDVNARTRSAVQEAVYDSLVNRRTKREFTDALAKAMGITKRRARLIANDQTHKLNIALTGYRNQQLGIEAYRWRHTPQEHPRYTHVARSGRLFRWDKPPKDGHPGFAINCKCVAEPVVELG